MRLTLALISLAYLVTPGCIPPSVVAKREVDLRIEQTPCFIQVFVDGDEAMTISGREHKINCPIEVDQ